MWRSFMKKWKEAVFEQCPFFNSFPYLMQAAFVSHQAAFLCERKYVCCVAGPCRAALFCKIKLAHIFEGVVLN